MQWRIKGESGVFKRRKIKWGGEERRGGAFWCVFNAHKTTFCFSDVVYKSRNTEFSFEIAETELSAHKIHICVHGLLKHSFVACIQWNAIHTPGGIERERECGAFQFEQDENVIKFHTAHSLLSFFRSLFTRFIRNTPLCVPVFFFRFMLCCVFFYLNGKVI